MTRAEALVDGLPAQCVIADMAFDADACRADLAERGIAAVIPSNPARARAVPYGPDIYQERHLVECFFNKIKQFRRIATRYEKTATAFLAMVTVAAMMIWLR